MNVVSAQYSVNESAGSCQLLALVTEDQFVACLWPGCRGGLPLFNLQSASSECLLPFCHFLSLILASINSLNNNKEKLKTAFGRSIVLHDDRLTWWANTITCVGVNTKTRISTLIRMARVQSGVGIFTDFDSFQQREAHAHKIGFLLHTFAKYWLTPRAPVWQN